jgi:uncharacterized repeat protein (TIGR01451 family)
MTSARLSARFISFAVLASLVLLAAPTAYAQNPPGRILSAPGNNNVIACNIDSSNCFTVAGYQEGNVNVAAPNSPSIANDGTIAFTAYTGPDGTFYNTPNVYFANADGTNVRQLTFFNSGQNAGSLYPAISPDATMAAFITNINSTPGGSRPQQIYLVNADGSNFRQLTAFDTAGPDPSQSYFDGMAWSPDSKKLALRGVVYTSVCGTYFGGPIYVRIIGAINADGTGFQILACDNGDGYVNSIDWSPDGTLLAWTRNVQHGAQGCSGCVGNPAIAFYDFTGQNRYSAGITATQLSGASSGDSCQDTACVHFSPDSTMLAYMDTFRDGNYCYGGPCYISIINFAGSNKVETSIQVSGEMWWMAGPAIPTPASMMLAPATMELWPGFSMQLTPSLLDGSGSLILHTANVFNTSYGYAPICTLQIEPFGLTTVTWNNGNISNSATVSATNAGFTSASVPVKCWPSPPCTYSLNSSSETFSQNGGSDSVGVKADPGQNASTCPWQAMSNASWITITSPALGNGAGNGSVAFTVAVNNTGQARQGTITINPAGTFTVYQSPTAADLSITKAASPNPVSVGSSLTYTLTVSNNGPSTATSVATSDTLPGSVTFVSSSSSQGSCAGTSTVTCALGSLANGASATVTIVVTPTVATTLSNTASVSANESDPNPSNNSDTRMTTVNPRPPTISGFTPTSGPVGTSVTIAGMNFTGASAVKFNGTSASFTNSDTQIIATVPSTATTGPISVTTPGGTATSSTNFTVTVSSPPTITSFTPTSGSVGTKVTIQGTNLASATSVQFNGTSATFQIKGTQIIAVVPQGATSGPISVTTPGGTATSADSFTVIPAPVISGFSPTSGPPGTVVAIRGSHFTGATRVTFNGARAGQFTVVSDTEIDATVPKRAKSGPISVTTPGGTGTSTSDFIVTK